MVLSGIPAAAGTNSITLTATNAYGETTNVLVLTIWAENDPPTVAVAAAANPDPVTGTTTALSVLGRTMVVPKRLPTHGKPPGYRLRRSRTA